MDNDLINFIVYILLAFFCISIFVGFIILIYPWLMGLFGGELNLVDLLLN